MKTEIISILTLASLISLGESTEVYSQSKNKSVKKRRQSIRILSINEAWVKGYRDKEKRRRMVGSITGYIPSELKPKRTGKYLLKQVKSVWRNFSNKIKASTPIESLINTYYGQYVNDPIIKKDIPLDKRYDQIYDILYASNLSEENKAKKCFLHVLAITKKGLKGKIKKKDNQTLFDIANTIKQYHKDHTEFLEKANSKIKGFLGTYKEILDVYK